MGSRDAPLAQAGYVGRCCDDHTLRWLSGSEEAAVARAESAAVDIPSGANGELPSRFVRTWPLERQTLFQQKVVVRP